MIAPLSLWGQNLHKGIMMYGDSSRTGRAFTKDPYVLKWKGNYLMYYSIPESKERGIGWGIGIAESRDLDSWQKVGEINPLQDSDLERKGICAPCAIVRNDTIHLFYQIYGNGALDAICHAYSVDGIHFVRNRTNPVFRPSGDWNCGRAIDAEVFEYNGQYFLYYATRDQAYQKQYLGVAVTSRHSSFDRDTWKQACSAPILFLNLLGKAIALKLLRSSTAMVSFICFMPAIITMRHSRLALQKAMMAWCGRAAVIILF